MGYNKSHPPSHDSIAPLVAFKQELVMQAFAALHPGNAVRFGISPLVFAAWKERHGGA